MIHTTFRTQNASRFLPGDGTEAPGAPPPLPEMPTAGPGGSDLR